MRYETYMCDSQGHEKMPAMHHVTLDGEDRPFDFCDQCIGVGLQLLLSDLTPAAQRAWAARVRGEG